MGDVRTYVVFRVSCRNKLLVKRRLFQVVTSPPKKVGGSLFYVKKANLKINKKNKLSMLLVLIVSSHS